VKANRTEEIGAHVVAGCVHCGAIAIDSCYT
jgi:hypothetical protein